MAVAAVAAVAAAVQVAHSDSLRRAAENAGKNTGSCCGEESVIVKTLLVVFHQTARRDGKSVKRGAKLADLSVERASERASEQPNVRPRGPPAG